jgi:hypothetical protein
VLVISLFLVCFAVSPLILQLMLRFLLFERERK